DGDGRRVCRIARVADQYAITERPAAKARADPCGIGGTIRGTGSETAGAPRFLGRAVGRSDLSGIAPAGRRASAKTACAHGHYLSPRVRAALDRPGASHVNDAEPPRPARHGVTG